MTLDGYHTEKQVTDTRGEFGDDGEGKERTRAAASEGGAEGVRVQLTVSPAGLDSFFEAARLLGACARTGEISAEAAMAALGAVREEVGVENMSDAEVVPLAKL